MKKQGHITNRVINIRVFNIIGIYYCQLVIFVVGIPDKLACKTAVLVGAVFVFQRSVSACVVPVKVCLIYRACFHLRFQLSCAVVDVFWENYLRLLFKYWIQIKGIIIIETKVAGINSNLYMAFFRMVSSLYINQFSIKNLITKLDKKVEIKTIK